MRPVAIVLAVAAAVLWGAALVRARDGRMARGPREVRASVVLVADRHLVPGSRNLGPGIRWPALPRYDIDPGIRWPALPRYDIDPGIRWPALPGYDIDPGIRPRASVWPDRDPGIFAPGHGSSHPRPRVRPFPPGPPRGALTLP